MRAANEMHTDGQGNLTVDILSEKHYFDRLLTGTEHEPVVWPAHLVWVD